MPYLNQFFKDEVQAEITGNKSEKIICSNYGKSFSSTTTGKFFV
jgi:hypothetical protein